MKESSYFVKTPYVNLFRDQRATNSTLKLATICKSNFKGNLNLTFLPVDFLSFISHGFIYLFVYLLILIHNGFRLQRSNLFDLQIN